MWSISLCTKFVYTFETIIFRINFLQYRYYSNHFGLEIRMRDFHSAFEEISHSRNNKQWRTDREVAINATPSNRDEKGWKTVVLMRPPSSRCTAFLSSLRKLVEYMADGIFGEGKRKQTSTKRDGGRKGPSKSRKPRETRHATFGLTLPARKRRKREDRLIQRWRYTASTFVFHDRWETVTWEYLSFFWRTRNWKYSYTNE